MELFSGLLLTLVVLAILGFVARELISDDGGGVVRNSPGESMRGYLGGSTATDSPMLGRRGTVLDGAGDRLRVRIEGERWRANPVAGAVLPAGTPIRVIAVNGLVLEVEPIAVEGDGEETPAMKGSAAAAE